MCFRNTFKIGPNDVFTDQTDAFSDDSGNNTRHESKAKYNEY